MKRVVGCKISISSAFLKAVVKNSKKNVNFY